MSSVILSYQLDSITCESSLVSDPHVTLQSKNLFKGKTASSPLAKEIESLNDNAFQALIHDLYVSLREYTDDDGIIFPTETYLAIARN